MNGIDLTAFYEMTPDQRLAAVRANRISVQALASWFGEEAAAGYARLARRRCEHLAGITENLIFLPGVMGSLLYSEGLAGMWWIDVARSRSHIDDLRLSPDGKTDANPDHDVRPRGIDPTYEAFFLALLDRDDFRKVAFSYDWRKSIDLAAADLRQLVDGVFARNGGVPVHLVGHSMGGLVIRKMLAEHDDDGVLRKRIGRIALIGTPNHGSPTIASYLAHHLWGMEWLALLGRYLSRATLRSLRGVLSLLPAPAGSYPGSASEAVVTGGNESFRYAHPCVNFDLYDAAEWDLGISDQETERLQATLNHAAEFHRQLRDAHDALPSLWKERMLMIAGVGYKSVFRLERKRTLLGSTEFEKVTSRQPGNVDRDGDGRVPLASAQLRGVEMRYVKGVHGGLTNIPAVYEDVFRWLREQPLQLPTSSSAALSEHLAAGDLDLESSSRALDRTDLAQGDDPGYLNETIAEETIDELAARLDAGDGGKLNLTRIL